MADRDRRSRSRSPTREHKRRRRHAPTPRISTLARPLPLGARELSKHDMQAYRPMFALYLDIQKQKDIDELADSEVKGRWKSFMNKWNRGELAEGWYDPETLAKAIKSSVDRPPPPRHKRSSSRNSNHANQRAKSPIRGDGNEEDDDDDYGPELPTDLDTTRTGFSSNPIHPKSGPSIPHTQDLLALHEEAAESAATAQQATLSALRADRKVERKLQTQRLDELAPRAETGTRERQLEKKKEANASNRSFAQAAHDGGDVELADADVMGDADSLGQLKRMKRENERKKNERELRREEMLRARRAEREEKMAGLRRKEEKTMEGLRALARARFGGGGGEEGDGGADEGG